MPETSENETYRPSAVQSFRDAAEARRAARRALRSQCNLVHQNELATNALHSTAPRWEDCYDCAVLLLCEARAALGMSPRPPGSCDVNHNLWCPS